MWQSLPTTTRDSYLTQRLSIPTRCDCVHKISDWPDTPVKNWNLLLKNSVLIRTHLFASILLILKHDLSCELFVDFVIFQRLICFHGWCGNCHLNTTWWSLTFWVNEGHFMAFCRSMCQKMSLMLGQNYMSKTEKTKCPKPCKTFCLTKYIGLFKEFVRIFL